MNRVERHIIKQSNRYYSLLDNFCFKSKNLYNFANYQIRQKFIKDKEYLNYYKMDALVKQENMDVDYRSMPTAQSAQQCLKLLDKNWKSFFASIKDYSKNADKYLGRPKLPKYLSKNGRNVLILTNQNCRLVDGIINFPKSFKGFYLKTKVDNLQQIRILPRNKCIIIEVVYQTALCEIKEDNGRYFSIDIGLDNLATITNNVGLQPVVINGKGLKSVNKYYNKQISHYREVAKRMNNIDYTNKMNRLTYKRNNKVEDYIHKASRLVIDYAVENNIQE